MHVQEVYEVPKANVTVFREGGKWSQPVTGANVRKAVADACAACEAGDSLMFYFSGYGTRVRTPAFFWNDSCQVEKHCLKCEIRAWSTGCICSGQSVANGKLCQGPKGHTHLSGGLLNLPIQCTLLNKDLSVLGNPVLIVERP